MQYECTFESGPFETGFYQNPPLSLFCCEKGEGKAGPNRHVIDNKQHYVSVICHGATQSLLGTKPGAAFPFLNGGDP